MVRTYLPLPVPAAACRGRRQQPTPPPPELRRATELTEDGAGEGLQPAGVGESTEAPGPWLNLSSKERPGRGLPSAGPRRDSEPRQRCDRSAGVGPPPGDGPELFHFFRNFQQIRIKIVPQNMAAASASCYRERNSFSFFSPSALLPSLGLSKKLQLLKGGGGVGGGGGGESCDVETGPRRNRRNRMRAAGLQASLLPLPQLS